MAFAQSIIGFFITADRDLLTLVSAIVFLITVALVALFAHQRKWTELIGIFLLIFGVLTVVAHLFFAFVVDVPIAKLEPISLSTD